MRSKKLVDSKTSVIFREEADNEVIALFPYVNEGNHKVLGYAKQGQHFNADYDDAVKMTKPIKDKTQFSELANELEGLGYNLNIMRKACKRKMHRH